MKFADTSFLFALLFSEDQWHRRALGLMGDLEEPLCTSVWVLAELANFCTTPSNRARIVALVRRLNLAANWMVVQQSDRWFAQGLDLYARRLDKEWSLTDCISFEVMRELGITEGLTADHPFEQAGFRALLR